MEFMEVAGTLVFECDCGYSKIYDQPTPYEMISGYSSASTVHQIDGKIIKYTGTNIENIITEIVGLNSKLFMSYFLI